MKAVKFLAGLMTFGVVATAGSAQMTGSRIGKNLNAGNASEGLDILAACYADGRSGMAGKLLATWPGSKEESAIVIKEVPQIERCMDSRKIVMVNRSMRFPPNVMRRRLGTQMAQRYLLASKAIRRPAPDTPFGFSQSRLQALGVQSNAAQLSYIEFGHCVALTAWDASLDLIRSVPGSEEEKRAINKVIPALGPCLTEGMEAKIERNTIRDIVGEPVYHLLADAPGGINSDA